ncbi:MAG: helix-turn-helix domain-containing protein [Candidatus Hydrogenedentes bacterium]|nr:helix-turn-helix domain-containing protein [Candidatus Hydrogenedentota bacterium]
MEIELLNAKQVARMLGVGESSLWRYRDMGALPCPVKIGRSVRWRSTDIIAWIDAGCPHLRASISCPASTRGRAKNPSRKHKTNRSEKTATKEIMHNA